MHASDKGGIEAKELREPLAIALLRSDQSMDVNSGRFMRSLKLASASSSGVVPALGASCVVRRCALRKQEESAAAPLMVCAGVPAVQLGRL